MKVNVTYRDVAAKQKYADAVENFEAWKKLGKAEKRNTTKPPDPIWKGLTEEEIEDHVDPQCISLDHLRKTIVQKLVRNPIAPGVILKPENIWVFKKEGDKLNLLEQGDTRLEDGASYVAVEVFFELPAHMYRTVALNQIHPCTFCLPSKRNFTEVSPFITAAMKDVEYAFPWISCLNGEIDFHGISVFCQHTNRPFCDDAGADISDDKWDPFKTVQKGINTSYSIPLEVVRSRVQSPHFGILKTTFTHKKIDEDWKDLKIVAPKAEKEERKRNSEATEQAVYYRFILEKFTNLRDHGMALVCDYKLENHCTIVRLAKEQDKAGTLMIVGGLHDGKWLKQCSKPFENIGDQELVHILSPNQHKRQPETIWPVAIAGTNYHVFPHFAPFFRLHDFEVKARAEPVPLETFEDDTDRMYRAALTLFNHLTFHDDAAYDVIHMLEALDYAAHKMDASSQKALLEAMERVRGDTQLEHMSEGEAALLDNGIELLRAVDLSAHGQMNAEIESLEKATQGLRLGQQKVHSAPDMETPSKQRGSASNTKDPGTPTDQPTEADDSVTPPDQATEATDPVTPPNQAAEKQNLSPTSNQTNETEALTASSGDSSSKHHTGTSKKQPKSLLGEYLERGSTSSD